MERENFSNLLSHLIQAKAAHKAETKESLRQIGVIEAQVLLAAINFAAENNDFAPVATYIHSAKPSGVAKRIIKAVFFNHVYMVNPETKMGAMVPCGDDRSLDTAKLHILSDVVDSGDTLLCDDIKAAFPAPKVSTHVKLTTQLKGFVDQGKITKAELSDIVASL